MNKRIVSASRMTVSGITIPWKHIDLISFICASRYSCGQQSVAQDKHKSQMSVSDSSIRGKDIPIWSKSIPDSELIQGTETYNDGMESNVSHPTITLFSPKENNTGVAILVFPGGGCNKLAIDLEGSEICTWLASIGVTGILLKYRVPSPDRILTKIAIVRKILSSLLRCKTHNEQWDWFGFERRNGILTG